MKKVSLKKEQNAWTELKKKKRKDFNSNYNKKRGDAVKTVKKLKPDKEYKIDAGMTPIVEDYEDVDVVIEGLGIDNFPLNSFNDPDEVPLDQCIAYITRSIGNDIEIVFRDDVIDEEILEITRIIREVDSI